MKRSERSVDLSRFVAAARSDAPDAAEVARALGTWPLPATHDANEPRRAEAVRASRLQLVKLGSGGLALVLVVAGAIWLRSGEPMLDARIAGPRQHQAEPHDTRIEPPEQARPHAVEAAPSLAVSEVSPQPSAAAMRERSEPNGSARAPATSGARGRRARAGSPAVRSLQLVDVDAESALIEAARSALRATPARTLELTAEHARRFGTGLLRLERDALAIHALALLGRTAEARARFQDLQRAHPQSIHVTRLQRVLANIDR